MTQLAAGQKTWLTICLLAAGICSARATADEGGDRLAPHINVAKCRVGFAGRYKVGYWTPIWVAVDGSTSDLEATIEIEVTDSDGVPTITSTAAQASPAATLLYAKIGRLGSPIHIRLLANGRVTDDRTLRPGVESTTSQTIFDMPATAELLLAVGPTKFGIAEAFSDRPAEAGLAGRRSVQLNQIADLPYNWFGYEAIDVLVLSVGDGALFRQLAADKPRFAAILEWLETGGRLVVLCGSRSAGELLADGAPLAGIAPGRLQVAKARLSTTSALEHFVESDVSIAPRGSGTGLFVPQLVDVVGRVEVYGAADSQLPLVIRSPRGLGEITFAALDLDAPPLAAWSGRAALLRGLLQPLMKEAKTDEMHQNLVTTGYDDLSGALRQRLGSSFTAVRPFSFGLVIALAAAYVLVLFPLDYLLIHKVLRRPFLAWITFPLILLLFTAGALALARSRDQAAGPSINQIELIDVDVAASKARGTYWASLYSPRAQQYNLEFEAGFPAKASAAASEARLSWQGLAGAGIGGMRAGGAELGVISTGYRYAAPNKLASVPVLAAATKSLTARWVAPAGQIVEAKLTDNDGLVTGSITNQSDVSLHKVRLLYGTWAYRLKDIGPGGSLDVGEQLNPISIQTLITGLALGSPTGAARSAERAALVADRASTAELLQVMMFYEAAGGAAFARLPLHYQSDCDLSRLLKLGRAVLVAEAPGPASRLIDGTTNQPLGEDQGDTALTVYRFVLPVERRSE